MIYLQLGTSRLEYLPDNVLEEFIKPCWVHLGDPEPPPEWASKMKHWVKRTLQLERKLKRSKINCHFEPFFWQKSCRLPFSDKEVTFVFSEHFFEHLFMDEGYELFKEIHRILCSGGVCRTVVPDADLRNKPESIGFPSRQMSWTHPDKHKTRWNVYSLTFILKLAEFQVFPVRFLDREGNEHNYCNKLSLRSIINPEAFGIVSRIDYIIRPSSLIIDAVK